MEAVEASVHGPLSDGSFQKPYAEGPCNPKGYTLALKCFCKGTVGPKSCIHVDSLGDMSFAPQKPLTFRSVAYCPEA